MTSLPVAVLGGGAFGWGLAHSAERAGRRVVLWSRRPQDSPSPNIEVVSEFSALADAELVIFAVPSPVVPALAQDLGLHLDGGHFLVHVSRGIVGDDLQTLSQVLRSCTPCRRVGALAGPLVADALQSGAPGAGIVASRFPEVQTAVREAVGGSHLRIYTTDDLIGAEFAATAVGLLAMAVGYIKGLGLGPATVAATAARGMAECTRIGVALGGRAETFTGLAGYGDLIAAVAGDGRPELEVGRQLATGEPLDEVSRDVGAYIEALESARRIAAYAQRTGIHAPLVSMCSDVFEGRARSEDVAEALMRRRVGQE